MEIRRVSVTDAELLEDGWLVRGAGVRRMRRVLRLRPSDVVDLLIPGKGLYRVRLVGYAGREEAVVQTIQRLPTVDPKRLLTLVMPPLKHEKIDEVLRRGVELGLSRYIPLEAERAVVHIDPSRWSRRVQRWQRIVQESLESSGCSRRFIIEAPMDLAGVLAAAPSEAVVMAPVEPRRGIAEISIWAWVQEQTAGPAIPDAIYLLLGPEGGWSDREIKLIRERVVCVHLGRRTLRSVTAALAAMAHLAPLLDPPP